jgi:hypothetical protein
MLPCASIARGRFPKHSLIQELLQPWTQMSRGIIIRSHSHFRGNCSATSTTRAQCFDGR